jgi:long-chain acyl-CoA synthetase
MDDIKDLVVEAGIGNLPSRAAATNATAVAFRSAGGGDVTYGELDESVDRCATGLRRLLGREGVIVAVAQVLDPVFAVAYYGIARAGNVSAVVNPLLHMDGLVRLLRACGAEAAILTPEMWESLAQVRDSVPLLRDVVLTTDLPSLAAGTLASAEPEWDSVASIVFTSGTTGAPKAVPLTHRNLTVNAAQTVHAQELDASAVMFNYFPTFHTMHLNAAVLAGATQVLYTSPDVVGSLEAAERHGVTHYYSLPMRLAQLANDQHARPLPTRLADHQRAMEQPLPTQLPDDRYAPEQPLPALLADDQRAPQRLLPTVRALLSGGSALPPRTAAALALRFGVPVVQGYGFAEASPLTHFNRFDDPRPGSCGRPVAGTECRVVDIGTRDVLPADEKGEVQIRGPQLMRGYLGQPTTAELDADGWFATGDVGRIDNDGYLFLVDRIRDVFKCDNFLVSPTEIEAVLRQHPAVADCAVVDTPDEVSGAVAYGLVVLRDTAEPILPRDTAEPILPQDTAEPAVVRDTPGSAVPRNTAEPAAIRLAVNANLPSFMRLAHVEPVAEIPRTRHGKVLRREIRDQLRKRLT